ncbi:MAG TPA: GNAT family N-acetyltransferase [Longimicrobiales bacterium]|nr:GNAT family N-acetyltransferase [Longimicrobiales bacterium]
MTLTAKDGTPFVAREMGVADRPALEAMYLDFEPKRTAQGLPPEKPVAIEKWLDAVLPNGTHILVDIGGEVLGHMMLIPIDRGRIELANFLHQSIRNRGIGTELNRLGVALAKRDGYRAVWLCVEPSNRAAIRSYEKAGFLTVAGTMFLPELEMEVIW